MTMTKGDAAYVNRVLQWMIGAPGVSNEDAYYCAAQLARRARAVTGSGVSPGQVEDCAAAAVQPMSGHHALARLLARCWELENRNGSWPGADIVPMLTAFLTDAGFDVTHPAEGTPGVPRGEWSSAILSAYARDRAHRPTP